MMMYAGHTLYIFYLTFKTWDGCAVTYRSWNTDVDAGCTTKQYLFDSELEN